MEERIGRKVVIVRKGYECEGFFFFQAEDGIRDIGVTGVQTCALPIFCFIRTLAIQKQLTGCYIIR